MNITVWPEKYFLDYITVENKHVKLQEQLERRSRYSISYFFYHEHLIFVSIYTDKIRMKKIQKPSPGKVNRLSKRN